MIVRNIPRHFVAPPLPAVTFLSFGLESKLSDSQLSKCSERGGCRVIPAQIVLFVAIADNHIKKVLIEIAKCNGYYRFQVGKQAC